MAGFAARAVMALGVLAFAVSAPVLADETIPPLGTDVQTRCDAPGFWPLPGTGGCLKIDGSGNLETGAAPSTVMGLGPQGASLPDLSAAFKVSKSWGSVQLSGVAGALDVLSAASNEKVLGWGVTAGGDFKLPTGEADRLGYNVQYGKGGQQYLMGDGLRVGDVYNKLPISGTAQTLESWGGSVWVQHWWSDTIRSNLIGGVVQNNVPSSLAAISPSLAERTWYGAANIIWSPMSQLNLGLEVIYGKNQTVGNGKVPGADEDLFRVQASVQRTF